MFSCSAETSASTVDESTFRGPKSGSNKLFKEEELKKLKVTLEVKKRKPAVANSGAAFDPSFITPVRRPGIYYVHPSDNILFNPLGNIIYRSESIYLYSFL